MCLGDEQKIHYYLYDIRLEKPWTTLWSEWDAMNNMKYVRNACSKCSHTWESIDNRWSKEEENRTEEKRREEKRRVEKRREIL